MADPLRRPEIEITQVKEQITEAAPSLRPAAAAFMALRLAFVVIPIVAGIDKYFDVLTNWDGYVAPSIYGTLHLSAHSFMQIAGVIEVIAGIGVALAPRFFGNVVCLWFCGIIINLLMLGNYYDIAARDFGLACGAFALAKLGAQFAPIPRRRLQALQ